MRESQEAREVNDRLGLLIAQYHAIGAEIVECLAELDALEGWQGEGYRSLGHFLSIRGSFTMAEAKGFERATVRLENVRAIHRDAKAGKFSVGVVAMAARVATPENEELIAKIVNDATPSQAARIFAKYRDSRGENGEPNPDPDIDFWEKHWVDDLGRQRFDLALDAPTGALFREAWMAARAAGEKDVDPTDLEQRRRLNANEIARRFAMAMLAAANDEGMSAPGGERYSVQVTADLATLARVLGLDFDPLQPVGLGECAFLPATGQRLTDAELSRIMCGADVQLLVHHNGVPLWLGREVRHASRDQRRALRFRAGGVSGCEFPGCTQTRFVDAHHAHWHSHEGPTDLDNLVLLCGYHHRQIHDHGWSVTTEGNQQFTFWRGERCLGSTSRGDSPGGRPPDAARLPKFDALPDPPPGITPDTPRSTGGGERLSNFGLSVYLEHLLAA